MESQLTEQAKAASPFHLYKKSKFAVMVTIVAVFGIVFAFYWPFRRNFFALDDFRYIENLFSTTKALFFGYNTTRFLSNLVFSPLYALFGFDPLGYNLFNIVLHIINVLLFAVIATRISGRLLIGGLTAIIFAASAAFSDAILWKCSYNTLMSNLFSFLAFYLYLDWRETGKKWRQFASLFVFLAAMYSKEDAAALPMLVCSYELICNKQKIWQSIRNAVPYALVVAFYLISAQVITRIAAVSLEHYERFLSFRPFYAIFAGYFAFLMNPEGKLASPVLPIIAGLLLAAVALFWVSDRRLLLFALAGVFLTFLPSSLTSLGNFTPDVIIKSISRYLYAPSAMASLCLACVLAETWIKLPRRVAAIVIICFLTAYIGYNYRQVNARGKEWYCDSEPVRVFLNGMLRETSYLPPKTYIFAIEPPVGRAYVQQALRAFYRNPEITWIADPVTFVQPEGSRALLFVCHWQGKNYVDIQILPYDLNTLLRLDH